MSFKEADKLSMITNKQFIHDLMPVHPVYVNMLSIEAKGVIGHAHNSTLPAMKILQREGFHRSNYVDIFDAGPTLVADLDDIRTIKDSQTLTVTNVLESVHADSYFISNTENDFRATTGAVMVTENGASLSRVDAETLNVEKGSQVSISPTIWK
jgi:arginine N-succinyltransferase